MHNEILNENLKNKTVVNAHDSKVRLGLQQLYIYITNIEYMSINLSYDQCVTQNSYR